MARALIIKNADFSANAVTTITFAADVPCTGLSFASDTISITGQTPVSIEYTVTPENTTDAINWVSSDTDIVTVANGVLTVLGIGTCTVTATCGDFSATVTVTVSITYIPNFAFINARNVEGYAFITGTSAYNRLTAVGSGEQKADYKIASTNGICPIKIPKNTASIKVSLDYDHRAMLASSNSIGVIWAQNVSCGASNFLDCAKWLSSETPYDGRTNIEKTFEIPADADCFVVRFNTASTYTAEDDPNSLASTAGFNIEFLTE